VYNYIHYSQSLYYLHTLLFQSEDTLDTPLHEAATANSVACVSYLLSAGASQDVCNASGETPFDCARQYEVQTYVMYHYNYYAVYSLRFSLSESLC